MVVVGGGLAGMATAARLAKLGYAVVMCEARDRLGGGWASELLAVPESAVPDGGLRVDSVPSVVGFPAPWRDLFRKCGRPLEAELARSGHALVPAPPARYVFDDGAELVLPTDRGEQQRALITAYGRGVADRWCGLVDQLDTVWQALRPRGWEAELTSRRAVRAVRSTLRPSRTVADLARDAPHPHLAALIRSTAYRQGADPERTPALCAVELSLTRTFGRWTVSGPADSGDTGRSSVLVEALADRLRLRRVEVRLGVRVSALEIGSGTAAVRLSDGTSIHAATVISTVDPWQLVDHLLDRRTGRELRGGVHRLSPAAAPSICHDLLKSAMHPADAGDPTEAGSHPGAPAGTACPVYETVRLDPRGVPTLTWRRPIGAGTLRTTHEWASAKPAMGAGVAWRGYGDWFRRPPVTSPIPGLYLAGPYTPAGNHPSATVLSAALAASAVHARLGGRPR